MVIVALYISVLVRHCPCSGQSVFFLQLHVFSCMFCLFWLWGGCFSASIFLLCVLMSVFMLGMQL